MQEPEIQSHLAFLALLTLILAFPVAGLFVGSDDPAPNTVTVGMR